MIYLDNSSTTRVKEAVAEKMANIMTKDFGNPSSLHRLGLNAEKIVKEARLAIAKKLNANPSEIFFTSCGTESDNTVVKGVWESRKKQGKRIITTAVEHPAILEPAKWCEANGAEVVYLPVDENCCIRMEDLKAALTEDTILVSVMYVNNEVGSIMPIKEIADYVHAHSNAYVHTDAVQAFGKLDIDVKKIGVDFLSVSGHKVHGPKGIGALYIKTGIHLPSFMLGGGQERGFRSGTESVPLIAGFGAAVLELSKFDSAPKDYLCKCIKEKFGDSIKINTPKESVPSVLNVSFLGCRAEVLLHMLEEEEIYVSTGSACSSNTKKKGSHVLLAMGLKPDEVEGAIRFSFSDENTLEQMDEVMKVLTNVVEKHRKLMKR
ncbi:MAG: cysteine desulfurase family protein [Bacillota bacterium]|nr:cysteine desulfurase family protein [Bacillota bacterium]